MNKLPSVGPIPVYSRDGVILAYVSKQATGIGACKAANVPACKMSLRFPNGQPAYPHCWIAKEPQ